MDTLFLEETAGRMVAPGKGIFAADISQRRLAGGSWGQMREPETDTSGWDFMEMMFRTPDLGKHISSIIVFDDIYFVVDDVARMGDPLAADHKLEFGVHTERIARATVPAGKANTAPDGIKQARFLFTRDGALRPDLNDEVQRVHILRVEVTVEGIGDLEVVTLSAKDRGNNVRTLFGFVPFPTSPGHKSRFCTFCVHGLLSV